MHRFGRRHAGNHMQRQFRQAASGDRFRMIQRPRRLPHHIAREFEFDGAIGNLGADGLMFHDVAATLTAHFRVIHRRVVARAADTNAHRRHRHAIASKQFAIGKRALAFLAQQIGG